MQKVVGPNCRGVSHSRFVSEDVKWSVSGSVMSDSWGLVDCSPPGFSVHGILQARILEWFAITFSHVRRWENINEHLNVRLQPCGTYSFNCLKVKVKLLSRVRLFVTLWTVTYQAPLSVEFSRQEYWSGLAFPSPGDLPDPGTKPGSPALQADSSPSEPPG